MRKGGFTLIECLLGLALSVFVITTGFEFFARAAKAFARLKEREEAGQAALAALDRMRIDLLHAGRGLSPEIGLGLVEGAVATADELRTTSLEKELTLAAEARAGDTRISVASTADVAAGQRMTLREGTAGEVRTVVRVEAGAVLIDAPLERSYAPATAVLSLLEVVTYFLDEPAGILRRRVNASPAQPLLEGTAAAAWSLDASSHLVSVRLELDDPVIADSKGAHPHEATVFLKNPALAEIPR
jgi:type II secretory pathway pseudopilin PulG